MSPEDENKRACPAENSTKRRQWVGWAGQEGRESLQLASRLWGHSLSFQVRGEGGKGGPPERGYLRTPPRGPAICCRSCLPQWEPCNLEKNWSVTSDSLSCRYTWNTVRAWRRGDSHLSPPPKLLQTTCTSPMPPSHRVPTQGHTVVKTQSVATAELGLDAFSVKEQPPVRQEGDKEDSEA